MSLEAIAQTGDDAAVSLTDMTGWPTTGQRRKTSWAALSYTTRRDRIAKVCRYMRD